MKAAVDAFGRLDYLVNSAGISAAGALAPLHEVDLAAFERVQRVNVTGASLGMKYAIPAMLAHGGGAVVNLSSTMGDRAAAGDPSYATSKHAVRGLTKSAVLTYATEGVRVNAVGPGVSKTGMTAPIFDDEQTSGWLLGITPMRRFGEARSGARRAGPARGGAGPAPVRTPRNAVRGLIRVGSGAVSEVRAPRNPIRPQGLDESRIPGYVIGIKPEQERRPGGAGFVGPHRGRVRRVSRPAATRGPRTRRSRR